jgi:hypothetical protein
VAVLLAAAGILGMSSSYNEQQSAAIMTCSCQDSEPAAPIHSTVGDILSEQLLCGGVPSSCWYIGNEQPL